MSHLLLLVMIAAFIWFARGRAGARQRGGMVAPPEDAAAALAEVAKEFAAFLPKEAAEALQEMAEQAAATEAQRRPIAGAPPVAARRTASPFATLKRDVETIRATGPLPSQGHVPASRRCAPAMVPPLGITLHPHGPIARRPRSSSVAAIARQRGLCSPR
ncbi:MAG: hypothetical protein JOY99_06840 [Sphingomonadaceae bacterium]|nr:hypothetical protein [Sphingomonadaceae bacterium]